VTKDGKIGIGIIGFGGIAQAAHAPGYRNIPDQCEIVAVADIAPERLEEARTKWGIGCTLTDYKQLLEMPEIDAVSVCTPNYIHAQPTIDALQAGKHVLCEKPMAINATQAAAMQAAAQSTGNKLQIGYNWRFSSGSQSLKRAVDAGKLGNVYYARAQALRRRGVPGWGVFTQKDKQGGGPLIDIGVHITDMTLWLMGHKKPVTASAMITTQFGTREGVIGTMGTWDPKIYTVEDFAVGLIRFEDGSTMTLESSFIANLGKDVFSTHLFGTEGGALFDMGDYTLYREEFGTLTDSKPGWLPEVASSHGEEVRAFVRAVRDDLTIAEVGAATGEQGLIVTQIMDALYRSGEERREVTL